MLKQKRPFSHFLSVITEVVLADCSLKDTNAHCRDACRPRASTSGDDWVLKTAFDVASKRN